VDTLVDDVMEEVELARVRAFTRSDGTTVTGHKRVPRGHSRTRVEASRKAAATRRARDPLRREIAQRDETIAAKDAEIEKLRAQVPATDETVGNEPSGSSEPSGEQADVTEATFEGERVGDLLDFIRSA
jgi:hypothetical protein